MNQPEKANGQAPDIKALLEEVDRRVAGKKAEGFYSESELRKVEEAALTYSAPVEDGYEAELNLRLDSMRELWNPKEWGVSTHREGALGNLILKAKKLTHKASGFFLSIWFARQLAFNDQMVKLLINLLPRHFDLRNRMNHNERRLDNIEDLGRNLTGAVTDHAKSTRDRLEAIDRFDRELAARLEALERRAGSGQARTEELLARLQAIVEQQAESGAVSGEVVRRVSAEREKSRGGAYLDFEDLHRGSREEIKKRQEVYLPIFQQGAAEDAPLLDIGCGRGEFLELCKENGINAMGVDLNPEMAAYCNERGLKVEAADAMDYLRGLADESLGGILASQVIEHLTPGQLTELVSLAAAKLKPGAAFAAETVNPQCLTTFSGAFYLDITHQKPIHPEAARFLWRWAGLKENEILYLSPYPPDHRLETFAGRSEDQALADNYNRNMDRLNQLLYSHQDYAVVGRK